MMLYIPDGEIPPYHGGSDHPESGDDPDKRARLISNIGFITTFSLIALFYVMLDQKLSRHRSDRGNQNPELRQPLMRDQQKNIPW